jgi:LCP family protein required for cell wall assembly
VARTEIPSSNRQPTGTTYGGRYGGGSGGRAVPSRPSGRPRRTGPRWGRIALLGVALLAVVGLVVGGCGVAYLAGLDGKLRRTDAFAGLSGRPEKAVDGTRNILILGSDSRDGTAPDGGSAIGERSDAIMVLHLPENGEKAYVISIPRDTYVFVPEYQGHGGRKAKINAAFAWGGIPLTVMTVERFTGVRIDSVVKMDFKGFKAMTDAVGGVDVTVDKTVYDPRSKRTFKAGVNHLDGAAALDYVRQRYNLPRGDFDRMQRQQIFLRALMQKATDSGTLSHPLKLKAFLDASTKAMTVDEDFSLRGTALAFRGIRPGDLAFITSPHLGSQNVNGESVVVSDKANAASLWEAVDKDTVGDWLADHPANNATRGR